MFSELTLSKHILLFLNDWLIMIIYRFSEVKIKPL